MQKVFTLFIFIASLIIPVKSFEQVNTQDSLALVSLYNSTNGTSWTTNTGWLSGPVSSWYGVGLSGNNVTSISLANNNLTGSLPASLGNISLLSYLNLSSNQLSGSIPYSLGNTNLNTLYLNNNQLNGTIPGTLGNLANLSDLELNNNQLTGSIPDSLQTLFSLSYLDLSSNQLSGSIPTALSTLFNLNNLYLYNNELSGSIPAFLATSTSLQSLNLNNNQLSGNIPATLGSASNLTGINISHNQLSGTIPSSLGSSHLFFLDISYNQLTGTVPSSFSNLTSSSTSINNNNLTFDGLETIVQTSGFNAGQLNDSTQAIIKLHLNGNILSVHAGGTLANDTFHWYKNGVLDTAIVGDSTYSPLLFSNYSVIVSNKIVTPLTGLYLHSDTLPAGILLPVTFLNFTGTLANRNALLQWQTAAQINTSYFNVQRSMDGKIFGTIGKIDATYNGSGTEDYQYSDDVSLFSNRSGNIFYRLHEVDKDGSSQYSKIVNFSFAAAPPEFSIYPNPVTNVLNIVAGNNIGNIMITVFDINGIKLLEQKQMVPQNGHITINTASFATGVYLIQLAANGTTIQQKFIKQ